MSKNIVVVTGSPRMNGNSEALADAFIEGAKESGKTVTKFNAGTMKINGCLACQHCWTHDGMCAQQDDMQDIYKALYHADMIVFATPIYWFGFTAQIKAMIDRMYTNVGKQFPIKSAALLAVYRHNELPVVDAITTEYKSILSMVGWEDKGIITQGGFVEKGDIQENDVLAKAKKLGMEV